MKKFKRFKIFYRKFGLYKYQNLTLPRVILQSELTFPDYSVIHTYDNDIYPNVNIPYFSNIESGIVFNKFFFTEVKDFIFKKKPRNIKQEISKFNKVDGGFETLSPLKEFYPFKNKARLLRTSTLIINYHPILESYRIIEKKDSKQRLFEATMKEILLSIKKIENRTELDGARLNHFIIQPLPKVLISFMELQKYRKEQNSKYYTIFHNFKRMFIAELFNLLDRTLSETSPFKAIDNFDKINFIFTYGEKCTIVNLKTLLSFSEKYPEIESKKKLNTMALLRMTHYFLHSIYLLNGSTVTDILTGKSDEDAISLLKKSLNLDEGSVGFTDNSKNIKISIDKLTDKESSSDEGVEEDIVDALVKSSDSDKTIKDIEKQLANIENEDENITSPYRDATLDTINNIDMVKSVENIINSTIEKNKFTKKRAESYLKKERDFLNSINPLTNRKIEEDLKISEKEIVITEEESKLPVPTANIDENLARDIVSTKNKKYIKEVYHKDMTRTIFSMQKSGLIIDSFEAETVNDILGDYISYKVKLLDPKRGVSNSFNFNIPVISDEGTFKISNNEYRLLNQKSDLPIKKIRYNRVLLSSAFGKLFIDRSPYKKDDRGFDLKKRLVNLQMKKKISNLVLGSHEVEGVRIPDDYTLFMRYIRSFKFSFNNRLYRVQFDYNKRKSMLKAGNKLETMEKGKYVLCGVYDNGYLLIDNDNILYQYDGKYHKLGTFFDLLNIDKSDLKREFTVISIYKVKIPLVLLLTYYLGLENLLKLVKVKYSVKDYKRRLDEDEGLFITFNDKSLLIDDSNREHNILFSGFTSIRKIIKDYPLDFFNNRKEIEGIFSELGIKLAGMTEIKLLENMFIDSVTESILEEMKEPKTFIGLLIRSNELLIDDFYKNPAAFGAYTAKGYERIPQIVYAEFIRSLREKTNHEFFGNSSLISNPYSVWEAINTDNSKLPVDDINPIADIKDRELVTALGIFGRKRESMSKSTRAVNREDIGVISESVKDSGAVGIANTFSANPFIKDVRGFTEEDVNRKLEMSNILSTSALLAPFTIHDDGKRANFTSIMNSHIIPISNAVVYPVRTGYESIVPLKSSKRFIEVATGKGLVTKVGKESVTIKYEDSKERSYKFKSWVGKEESNSAFRHTLVSDLKVGDTVESGDVIYYDKGFFARDMFNPKQVVYRAGTIARVALTEINETNEDSCVVTNKFANATKISYISVRSIILSYEDTLKGVLKVGDKVDYHDVLFTFGSGLANSDHLDKETLDLLQGFIQGVPKAEASGTIVDIKAYYNFNLEEATDSIKKFVNSLPKDKRGEVGNNYSIKGVPLQEGQIEIKYYIESKKSTGVGDKAIFANQLKTTLADVIDHDFKSEDGRDLDALFSGVALSARIVESPYLEGTTTTLLKLISEKAVEIYYGK